MPAIYGITVFLLGRDIIVKQNSHIIIVQCKYRGKKKDGTEKEIHENSINNLVGIHIFCIQREVALYHFLILGYA